MLIAAVRARLDALDRQELAQGTGVVQQPVPVVVVRGEGVRATGCEQVVVSKATFDRFLVEYSDGNGGLHSATATTQSGLASSPR